MTQLMNTIDLYSHSHCNRIKRNFKPNKCISIASLKFWIHFIPGRYTIHEHTIMLEMTRNWNNCYMTTVLFVTVCNSKGGDFIMLFIIVPNPFVLFCNNICLI